MLPDYIYFVALAVLLLVTVPSLLLRAGRRRLLQSLPAFAFFALLLLVAEVAFRVGLSQGGGSSTASTTIYTCSMHPAYEQRGPGHCPICGMELVPKAAAGDPGSHEIRIDPVVVQNIGVRVATAARGAVHRTVRAFGELRAADSRLLDVALKFDGFVEQLFANTEGMEIASGAPLFTVYAPELVVAQAELSAARKSADAALLQAARQKLLLWGVSAAEVDRLQALDEPERVLRWPSPMAGVLLQKNVVAGAPAEKNKVLLRIADLSVLWLDAQVPEQQLGQLAVGQHATAQVPALPAQDLDGRVVFVAPEVDRTLRTATVRVEVAATGGLRPGMFARVRFEGPPGDDVVLIPAEAAIDTGNRSIVWLAVGKGRFEPREVRLGRHGDDGMVEVLAGIDAGDVVVTSGQFLIDAESRLREGTRKWTDAGTMPGGDLPVPAPLALAAATQDAADALLAAYVAVADALARDRADAAAWRTLQQATAAIAGAPEPAVQQRAADLALALQHTPADLESMRVHFKAVSAAALHLFEAARPREPAGDRQQLFVHHCPMAEADWLQLEATTRNPYYGSAMPDCGEVRRTLPLQQAGGK